MSPRLEAPDLSEVLDVLGELVRYLELHGENYLVDKLGAGLPIRVAQDILVRSGRLPS